MDAQARDFLGADAAAGLTGWRRPRRDAPLSDVYRSIAVPRFGTDARKLAAFLGPGYLVAVGYMDPGNWATSIAGGSKFGYTLLVVALVSNIMAIVLQSLCARLAIASGRDLAQACRDAYPKPVALVLWLLAELAIVATDLAEVIGTAIGLNLLFGIPLEIGVLITALDVFLILYLQKLGFRYLEALIVTLLGVIARLLRRPDRARRPAMGRGHPRLRADHRDRDQSRDALPRARHPGRDGDAPQPLPALGHRADPRLRRIASGEARGAEVRHHRLDGGADVRAPDQRLHPDPGRGGVPRHRPERGGGTRRGARPAVAAARLRLRARPCSASRCSAAGSTRP